MGADAVPEAALATGDCEVAVPAVRYENIMDAPASKGLTLHFDAVPRGIRTALVFLSRQSWLERSWYLAGGSALALQTGHRRSFDLDFFSKKKNFDNDDFLQAFKRVKAWRITMNRKNTIYGELFKTKISFIAYPFFVPKQPFLRYGSVRLLAPPDIAVMKIIAISQRGRKRDFFDLYWCSHHVKPLEDIVRRLKVQYPALAHDYHHILKALVYFQDAEGDPEPVVHFDADWRRVKRFFTREIPAIADRLMR